MAYKMWKKGRTNDYSFIDSAIAEQYNIGGVDMWLYAYCGEKPTSSTGDYTTTSSSESSFDINSVSDWVFGDTSNRKYNLEAITFSCVYQVQEATPDMKLPGLFFDFNTMDITVHYNDMMKRLGRKILPGDVIELPNLRDFDVIGKDSGINRFYVVQDAFKTYEGYSATWQAHIWKIRVKPITDSPEYSDLLQNNSYPDNPDDPNNGNGNGNNNSNYQNEMDIMNKIITIAENDVPYLNFDNEQFYDPRIDYVDLSKSMLNGYDFPEEPANNMLYLKKTKPVLKENVDDVWNVVSTGYDINFPSNPTDGDFFFKEDSTNVSGFSLYQYDNSSNSWLLCDVEYSKEDKQPKNNIEFYVKYSDSQVYQYKDDSWIIPSNFPGKFNFNTSNINDIIDDPNNYRPEIPPQRGSVPEGTEFPSTPTDGEYFFRTDYNPVTCWKYNADSQSWVVFDYGNRIPWLGSDPELVNFVNSSDRMPLHDIASTPKYRKE
ncbi:hypothetical protein [Klebsiella phage K64-1]|uniref:Uncharacterized protein n=1 Tax=Klebsiella phage K64-1 TaxID=1439894 RepID=A0A0A8JBL6_BPK64|nr:virion structural protein [Klebsiella phage K64-1]BAQ02792.1 hypothetical protein [Klebsiella phage K64-1]